MISPEAVVYAYRLILGREPESAEVVQKFAGETNSLAELGRKFLKCPEFRLPNRGTDARTAKPIRVDVDVSDATLAAMIHHVEAAWEELGRVDPHWSVLTQEKFRAATIGDNEAAFYATGEVDAAALKASALRCGITLDRYRDCFELGCGVGRVTQWLSKLFPYVLGADISTPHLELAREALNKYACHDVQLLKLQSLTDLGNIPEFDVFFSVIVLQHNPPPVIAYMLRAILGKMRPGGIGYFQLPTYKAGYEFNINGYMQNLQNTGRMEMHILPQDALFALFRDCDCQLLEIREDDRTGSPEMVSNSILVRKQ